MAIISAVSRLFGEVLTGEDGKQSFGRTFSLPYFFSAWAIGTAAGVRNVIRDQSVFDDAALLAGVGFALYTGSKSLSIVRGKVGVGKAAMGTTPTEPPQ